MKRDTIDEAARLASSLLRGANDNARVTFGREDDGTHTAWLNNPPGYIFRSMVPIVGRGPTRALALCNLLTLAVNTLVVRLNEQTEQTQTTKRP